MLTATLPRPSEAHAAEMLATREDRLRRYAKTARDVLAQYGPDTTMAVRADDVARFVEEYAFETPEPIPAPARRPSTVSRI